MRINDVARYNADDVKDRAIKAVKSTVSSVQDGVQSGLAKNAKRTSKNLKNAQENLRDTRDALQSQLKKRARRRARARAVFRLGILTGVGLMLLYAPWPGSETRRQLVAFWQGLFPRQD